MKKIKIFLASSRELEEEREKLADLICNLNCALEKLDIQILLVKWEYLDASMSGSQHKQEDYNDKLKECDIFLSLFWKKLGEFTKIEFETAYKGLKEGQNPKKLLVYFKEVEDKEISKELKKFQDSFESSYGHFESRYSNLDILKTHFLQQFINYESELLSESDIIKLKDGKVLIGGKVYIDLENVPFLGNNDDYNTLLKDISLLKETLKHLPKDLPIYAEYEIKLHEKEGKKQKLESSLWDTALEITRLSNQECSERLQRAIYLFNKGDNKGARALLNEEEIDRDIEYAFKLVEIGDEGKKKIKSHIAELKFKIKTWLNEPHEGLENKVLDLHNKIIKTTKKAFAEDSKEFLMSLFFASQDAKFIKNYDAALHYEKDLLAHLDDVYTEKRCPHGFRRIFKLEEEFIDYKQKEIDYLIAVASYLENNKIEYGFVAQSYLTTLYQKIGYYFMKTGHKDMALSYYSKIKKNYIQDPFGIYSLALNYTEKKYGNIENWERISEELLKIEKSLWGKDHYEIIIFYIHMVDSLSSLSLKYSKDELVKKIKNLFFKIVKLLESKPPIKDLYLFYTYRQLGLKYRDYKDYDEALKLLIKANEFTKKKSFDNDENNKRTKYLLINEISKIYFEKKEYEESLKYLKIILDAGVPIVTIPEGSFYVRVGITYYYQRRYEESLKYHLIAFDLRFKKYGDEDSYTDNSYRNIGLCYFKLGKYREAINNFSNNVRIRRKKLGELNIETLLSYYELGQSYFEDGQYEMAVDTLKKVYDVIKNNNIQNPGHLNITKFKDGSYYLLLAKASSKIDINFDDSIKYCCLALDQCINYYGELDLHTDEILWQLGLYYYMKNEFKQAMECFLKNIKIRSKIKGENSKETMLGHNRVGKTYLKLKQYDKSIEFYEKALEIAKYRNKKIPQGVYTKYIAITYTKKGKIDMAKLNLEEVLRLLPEDHPEAIDARRRLEELGKNDLKESEQ